MKSARVPLLVGVVLLAAVLRGLRVAERWDEIALAYAAYQQPWVDAFLSGDARGIVGTFVGLHPPAYSLLYGLLDVAWGAPLGWLLLSAGLSLGAVALVGRVGGVGPALLLAADPIQLAYAAEVNNYPLLVFAVALCLHEHARVQRGGSWVGLALAGVLAGWTHVLGGLVAGLLVLTLYRDRGAVLRVLGVMAVGTAPVIIRALSMAGGEDTYGQAGLQLDVIWTGLVTKASYWWVVAWVVAAIPMCRWRLSLVLVLVVGGVLAMMGLGVAASHQQPYWVVLGPLVALAPRREFTLGMGVLALGLAWTSTVQPAQRLSDAVERPRGIDAALASTSDGDALWLLAPALMPDDDKTMDADVLWRFDVAARMPAWRGPDARSFEFTDYRHGQPRVMAVPGDGTRIVHTTTSLEPAVVDQVIGWHHAAGRRIVFVLYDHSPANDYPGFLRSTLGPHQPRCAEVGADVGLGVDLVCEVD